MATKDKKILLPDDPPTGTGVQGEVATQSPQTQPAQSWDDEYEAEEREGRSQQVAPPTGVSDGQLSTGEQAKREIAIAKQAKRGDIGTENPLIAEMPTSAEQQRRLSIPGIIGIKPPSDDQQQQFTLSGIREALKKQYHIESDAERAAREKNERRAKLFASIGDGISALSDMYFSTQGAPMVHDPASGMSERLRQRYEKLDAERKANEAAYQHGYLRQLEQMQRAKKEAAAAALEAEYRRSQIDANEALAGLRGIQARNSTTRTDAYADSIENRNANNTRRTDAFVSRTENQNQNNNARTQLAAQRAANSGRGGRSTGSGTRRRTGRGNTSGTQTRNNGGLGTNPRGL